MAGRYGRKYAKDEDFEEGEVWGVIEGKKGTKTSLSSTSPTHFFTAPKMIPKSSSSEIFTANNNSSKQSSAPVHIPDWSKIYGKKNTLINNSVGNNNNYCDGVYFNGYSNRNNGHYGNDNDENNNNEDEDEDEDEMVPPHEYIARKFARNQITSFSVYEGIGRTLKGRDLSRVRNTILSKTGFLE